MEPRNIALIAFVCVVCPVYLLFKSFDTLEYQELGLNYSWFSEHVESKTYSNGRFFLGLGNSFLRFPRMVTSLSFLDDRWDQNFKGPALQSRTFDGLEVRLEVSLQYRLVPSSVVRLYTTLGMTYEQTFVRMAIEEIAAAATHYNASVFFSSNRTTVAHGMKTALDELFRGHNFAIIQNLQLRNVHLPRKFHDAITATQSAQQQIVTTSMRMNKERVQFATRVMQAEKAVEVVLQQADGEANAILKRNVAFNTQFNVTQKRLMLALSKIKDTTGWTSAELLDYMRLKVLRDHPARRTAIKL